MTHTYILVHIFGKCLKIMEEKVRLPVVVVIVVWKINMLKVNREEPSTHINNSTKYFLIITWP